MSIRIEEEQIWGRERLLTDWLIRPGIARLIQQALSGPLWSKELALKAAYATGNDDLIANVHVDDPLLAETLLPGISSTQFEAYKEAQRAGRAVSLDLQPEAIVPSDIAEHLLFLGTGSYGNLRTCVEDAAARIWKIDPTHNFAPLLLNCIDFMAQAYASKQPLRRTGESTTAHVLRILAEQVADMQTIHSNDFFHNRGPALYEFLKIANLWAIFHDFKEDIGSDEDIIKEGENSLIFKLNRNGKTTTLNLDFADNNFRELFLMGLDALTAPQLDEVVDSAERAQAQFNHLYQIAEQIWEDERFGVIAALLLLDVKEKDRADNRRTDFLRIQPDPDNMEHTVYVRRPAEKQRTKLLETVTWFKRSYDLKRLILSSGGPLKLFEPFFFTRNLGLGIMPQAQLELLGATPEDLYSRAIADVEHIKDQYLQDTPIISIVSPFVYKVITLSDRGISVQIGEPRTVFARLGIGPTDFYEQRA